MKRITFSIGMTGSTRTQLKLAEDLMIQVYGGYTLVHGFGGWKGETQVYREPQVDISAVVESDVAAESVAKKLAILFDQEAVMVAVVELKEVRFVGQ